MRIRTPCKSNSSASGGRGTFDEVIESPDAVASAVPVCKITISHRLSRPQSLAPFPTSLSQSTSTGARAILAAPSDRTTTGRPPRFASTITAEQGCERLPSRKQSTHCANFAQDLDPLHSPPRRRREVRPGKRALSSSSVPAPRTGLSKSLSVVQEVRDYRLPRPRGCRLNQTPAAVDR